MRITKQLAYEVASAALLDRKNKLELERIKLDSEVVASINHYAIPKEVQHFLAKFPEWVCKRNSIHLIGDVQERDPINLVLNSEIFVKAVKYAYSSGPAFELPDTVFAAIKKKFENLEDSRKQINKDQHNLEVALVAFGTKLKVIKHLPELEKFFPAEEKGNSSVALSVESIRNILKS